MTIASAFNEITVAQGGTASKSGSITGAIDKLNDVLAGSDQEAAGTIEGAIRLLGQHIGGGGGSSTVKCYIFDADNFQQALNADDLTVKDSENVSVTVSADQITLDATYDCVSFTANVGGMYTITSGNKTLNYGSACFTSDPTAIIPSSFSDSVMTLVVPSAPSIVMADV